MPLSIFWHRRDLRIEDNAGLYKALKGPNPVQPLFIFDSNILHELDDKDDARVTFIHGEIDRLKTEYRKLGVDLWVLYGSPQEVWSGLLQRYDVTHAYTNRDYEPYAQKRDAELLKDVFQPNGVSFQGAKDHVIFEKNEVVKDDGSPYLVYSPYARKWKSLVDSSTYQSFPVEKETDQLNKAEEYTDLIGLEEMGFVSANSTYPSREIEKSIVDNYDETRNFPAIKGTTRLSVHLRFGTISLRKLAKFAAQYNEKYLNELIWRDFYQMILFHHPSSPVHAIKPAYDQIIWEHNDDHFSAWKEGNTGYPLVDAGMRELNVTGFMHNRVRMVVASFLTKHLLLDWRLGERYFAQKLLDFELASNVGGWQWASGSGCDAAPYFRIFNPSSQLQKFDKNMKYVQKWVPEYGTSTYPEPIVEHKWARERALKRYKEGLESANHSSSAGASSD